MFKGMPKIFWIGTGLMYSYVFLFMILEMTIPRKKQKKVFGIPACYIYNWIMALWIINVIISYIFFASEEKREEKLEQEGGNHGS
ncbi:MAG: hypothetical protein MI747_12930 [Desulfobacterales bacterium]|nr:hypothetical protein [Desulfobacterales bacterium]